MGIIQQLKAETNFRDFPVNNNEPYWNNARVLDIRKCPSFIDGCGYIIQDQFMYFLNTLPNIFVIVVKCGDSQNMEFPNQVKAALNSSFNANRPLIIFFESPNSWKILYKDYGANQEFMEVEELWDPEAQQVTNFSSLMASLQGGGSCGFFQNNHG